MDTKTCTKCGAVKTLDEFYNQRDGRFGKTSRCGECMTACGLVVEDGDFSLDHRIPITCGGKHAMENCQTAHLICNIRKQDKPLEQCGHLWMRN